MRRTKRPTLNIAIKAPAQLMLVAVIAIVLQACNTAYVPNTVNVPLLRNANEVRIYADPKVNVQAAYAITDEIGVMASGHVVLSRIQEADDNTTLQEGSGSMFDAGIGFQKVINPNIIMSGDLMAEVYAGAGYGSMSLSNASDGKHYEVSATKVFIQPSLGYSHRYLEVAFTPRIVGLMYGEPTTGYTDDELHVKELPDRSKPMHWFVEPTITVRGGIQEVKLQFQIGQSFKLTSTALAYEKVILVLGLSFNLGRDANRTSWDATR